MAAKAHIARMAYCLPSKIEESARGRLQKKTGILRRHICPDDMTAADMAAEAAGLLFSQGFPRDQVDFLLFCTQSPDYILPTTACTLQERLGLPTACGALDYNLGCSGYVYGLGLAKGLVESGQARQVLLLTAETYSKHIHPEDRSTRCLFGDAATATVVAAMDTEREGIYGLVYGTDGSGAKNLIVPVGGMRHRYRDTAIEEQSDQYGNRRTNRDLFMDGNAIMEFALEAVPRTVDAVLAKASLERRDIGYYVFHQANRFMLGYLQDTCGLLGYPYWNDVSDTGNTVSSSIPLALVDLMRANGEKDLGRVMLVGFGVGLSWGGCIVDLNGCVSAARR